VDLGPSSEGVLSYALALAEGPSQIVALHVVEGVGEAETEGTLRFSVPESGPYRDALVRDARERLQRIVPEAMRARCAAAERVVVGRAYKSIVKVAEAENVDMIVVGLHGHGEVHRLFFGGTANHVVRQAPCPVLVVRPIVARNSEMGESIDRAREKEHAAL
jgi:nucleotide-binding universal stress UspA family protein